MPLEQVQIEQVTNCGKKVESIILAKNFSPLSYTNVVNKTEKQPGYISPISINLKWNMQSLWTYVYVGIIIEMCKKLIHNKALHTFSLWH